MLCICQRQLGNKACISIYSRSPVCQKVILSSLYYICSILLDCIFIKIEVDTCVACTLCDVIYLEAVNNCGSCLCPLVYGCVLDEYTAIIIIESQIYCIDAICYLHYFLFLESVSAARTEISE